MTLILIGLLLSVSSSAVAAEAAKIGYVNVQYLIKNSPQAEAASTKLQQKFAPKKQELDKKKQKLQKIQKKLQKEGLTLSESKRNELKQQAQQLQRDIKRSQKALQEDLNIERNDAFRGVRESVMKAVEAVAKNRGYDVVVGQGALYASEAVDITDRVLERMKSKHQSGGN